MLSPVPLSDEQARAVAEAFKFGSQSLETARAAGGFLARILGTAPEDLVGILGGDRLRFRRMENLVALAEGAGVYISRRNISQLEEPSLSVSLPLLDAAADESRPEVLDLWSRLLAAAMDPKRAKQVRRDFIEAVKAMEPSDALVFSTLTGHRYGGQGVPAFDVVSRQAQISQQEALLSLHHLHKLGCIVEDAPLPNGMFRAQQFSMTVFGTQLRLLLTD